MRYQKIGMKGETWGKRGEPGKKNFAGLRKRHPLFEEAIGLSVRVDASLFYSPLGNYGGYRIYTRPEVPRPGRQHLRVSFTGDEKLLA